MISTPVPAQSSIRTWPRATGASARTAWISFITSKIYDRVKAEERPFGENDSAQEMKGVEGQQLEAEAVLMKGKGFRGSL